MLFFFFIALRGYSYFWSFIRSIVQHLIVLHESLHPMSGLSQMDVSHLPQSPCPMSA